MEVAVKLSFLSQNWERLFSGMVETAADEVQDEAVYKRTKMAQMRSNTNAWLGYTVFVFLFFKLNNKKKLT